MKTAAAPAASHPRPQTASAPGEPPAASTSMRTSSASAPPLHPTPRGMASLPPRPGKRGVLASARRAKNLHGFAQGLVSVPAPPDVQELLAARKREEELEERGGQLPIRENNSINEWDEVPTESSETSGTTTSWAARNRATAKWVGDLPDGVTMDPNLASEGQQEQDGDEGQPHDEGHSDQQPEESRSDQQPDDEVEEQVDDERQRRIDEKLQRQKEKRKASYQKWKLRKAEQKRREQEEAQQRQQQTADATPAESSAVAPAELSVVPPVTVVVPVRWPNPPPKPERALSEWDRPYNNGEDTSSSSRISRRNKTPHTASPLARLGPPPPPAAATTTSSVQSVQPAAAAATTASASAWDEPYVAPADEGGEASAQSAKPPSTSAWDEPYVPLPANDAAQGSHRQPTRKTYPKKQWRSRNGNGGGGSGSERQYQQQQHTPAHQTVKAATVGWD